ncbi:hypothetical protein, partial [Acidomonas methanolica]|uniref:hypothetical protein n=1 Tax=Acidomonas methanolica TaxID=437 RepID=UPI0019552442
VEKVFWFFFQKRTTPKPGGEWGGSSFSEEKEAKRRSIAWVRESRRGISSPGRKSFWFFFSIKERRPVL